MKKNEVSIIIKLVIAIATSLLGILGTSNQAGITLTNGDLNNIIKTITNLIMMAAAICALIGCAVH